MKERNRNALRYSMSSDRQRFIINQQQECSTVLQGNKPAPFPKVGYAIQINWLKFSRDVPSCCPYEL